jgi:hypothetical protein
MTFGQRRPERLIMPTAALATIRLSAWTGLGRVLMRFVACVLVLALAVASPVIAAEDDASASGTSYLPLYPPGDLYQIQVIGDGLSYGLQSGLTEAFRGDPRIQVKPKVIEFYSLMRGGFGEDWSDVESAVSKEQPTVAVVIFQPMERISIRIANKKFWIDSEEWRAEFGRQVDVMMKAMKQRRIAVYWVSMPNVRRAESNEDVQTLNEIIREKALVNGIKYIDAYQGFTDEAGGYSAMGPDLTGKIRVLREPNGINFTEAGNRKLAHFVEREVKRDLVQARKDRTIPLAGGESEQQAIAAARQAQVQAQAKPVRPAATTAASSATDTPATAGGAGEQKADNGRISLALVGTSGREDVVTVELLRPAIPASVLALVNKRDVAERATNLGDLLIDKIPGGLIVMSSITPAADGGTGVRSRLPPTQTPYFRVMVKGERMPVKADRADDVAWPRPEPPPLPPEPAVQPAKLGPPAAAPATPPRKDGTRPKRAEQDPGTRTR